MFTLVNLFGLAGKRALVTGGATGVGRMIAEALAMTGADVLIASRKEAACLAAAEEINATGLPGHVTGLTGDVSAEAGILALSADVAARGAGLDILINNAGVSWGRRSRIFRMRNGRGSWASM